MAHCVIWSLLFVVVVLQNGCMASKYHHEHHHSHSDTWEYLMFSQSWPATRCMDWREKSTKNTCGFPRDDNLWTIHGVWPSNPGSMGPENCNPNLPFNLTTLQPILNEMREYWMNVETNTPLDSLWKHEWLKHGTCAMSLNALNSELKYFSQGLKWSKGFNMESLRNAGIEPTDKGYMVSEIFNAVQVLVGKRPIIQCIIDKDSKQSLLSEIRLCFNKKLQLVDCDVLDHRKRRGNVLTNCREDKLVYYLEKPTRLRELKDPTNHEDFKKYLANKRKLFKWYNVVKLLMWSTL